MSVLICQHLLILLLRNSYHGPVATTANQCHSLKLHLLLYYLILCLLYHRSIVLFSQQLNAMTHIFSVVR